MARFDQHNHRDSDSGQYHEVPTSGSPDRYAGYVPLSGKIEHQERDGEPFGQHEIGPGWLDEPVSEQWLSIRRLRPQT
jgi:hypothetical protein